MKNNQQQLKGFIKQIRGISYKPHQVIEEQKEGYIPLLRATNILDGNLDLENVIYVEGALVKEEQLLQEGDILIAASSGSLKAVGKSASFNGKGKYTFGAFCKVVRPVDIQADYLVHYFNTPTFRTTIQNQINGANIKNIKNEHIDNLSIFIPDSSKQSQIVNLLNLAKNLINKRQSQIAALDELTKSVFLEMFGDPVINTHEYTNRKLSDLCLKITDGTHHSPPMVEEGIPYVSAKHLGKGYLDFYSNPVYVSKEEHDKIYKRCDPIKGDVLYIKDGATTGIAGINHYNFEFSMLSSLALIRTDSEKLNNYYLVHYLNNERVKDKALSNMSGGAIKRLTIKKINDFPIMVPPIDFQKRFAIKIIEIEKQKESMKLNLNNLIMLYNALLQKAFKGELFQNQVK